MTSTDSVYQHARLPLARELRSEMTWRLTVLTLVGSAIFATLLLHAPTKQVSVVFLWGGLSIAQIAALLLLIRQQRARSVYRCAFVVTLAILGTWVLIAAAHLAPSIITNTIFVFLIVALGSLPWRPHMSVLVVTLFVALSVVQVLSAESPLAVLLVDIIAVFIALRTNLLSFLGHMHRAGLALLLPSAVGTSATATLRLLARCLAQLNDSRRALMIQEPQNAEIVSDGGVEPVKTDPAFLAALLQAIEGTGIQDGVLAFSALGPQFRGPLVDWFGSVPSALFFSRFVAFVDQREERVTIAVPFSLVFRLAVASVVQQMLSQLSAVARASVSAARSRVLSSDVLVASQRTITERENEINQMVHLVNNVAQDLAIHCDRVREQLGPGLVEPVRRELEAVEMSLRTLSAGVSDVKWLKELMRLRECRRAERVDVGSVVSELELYGRHRALRKSYAFEVQVDVPLGVGVEVVSREFLEASLRLFLRVAGNRVAPSGRIRLFVRDSPERVSFCVEDDGQLLDERARQRIFTTTAHSQLETHVEDGLRAVVQLASFSRGEFQCESAAPPFVNMLRLSLPRIQLERTVEAGVGQWVLLVDDSTEVTTFYTHVAEALNLRFAIAATVAEAESLLARQGRPKLVITDVNLTDGSGLDLVKHVRSQYGTGLPIIAVSGNADTETTTRARECGVTRYLTKPVGRRKLFAEIQELLG